MANVVEFAHAYRLLGRPTLKTNNSFSYKTSTFRCELNGVVQKLRDSRTGRFDELLIDGVDVDSRKLDLSPIWVEIEFTFLLDTSGSVPVFRDFDQLMARSKSFVREFLPPHIYLIDDDVLSSEEPVDRRVEALRAICQLIVCLADLAHFHDEKELSDEYKLVFVAEDSDKGELAFTLYPYLDQELISCDVGTGLVDSLQGGSLDENPHLSKERSIFRASLIEYLSGYVNGKERFKKLITTWAQFLALYEKNLSTYLSGFSFHKAKQEVATAQLAIADQMSKVISDISGKILSLPISLAATIAITKADNVIESSILVLGIAVTSALMAETLAAQKLQYERIKHSRTIMFSAHQQKIHHYPKDLRDYLSEAIAGLRANERKLRRSLCSLRFISWMPALMATLLHGYIYFEDLQKSTIIVCSAIESGIRCIYEKLIEFPVMSQGFI